MNQRQRKFENPRRVDELNPKNTLIRIGINKESTVLDYGTGTGIFTIPASTITDKIVYAYDIDQEMINLITKKVEDNNMHNVLVLSNEDIKNKVDALSIDNILLVTVYHEIDNKSIFFDHCNKYLNKTGKISIIEFHYKETPMGPPVKSRISRQSIIDDFSNHNYKLIEEFDLGENFYLVSFVTV